MVPRIGAPKLASFAADLDEASWDELERYVSCMSLVLSSPERIPAEHVVRDGAALPDSDSTFPLLRLSLIGILVGQAPAELATWRQVDRLVGDVQEGTTVESALLLYKGMAARRLGRFGEALDLLSRALAETEGRPRHLVLALHYERAQTLRGLRRDDQARIELEAVYAEDPGFCDVAEQLGL